MCMCHIYGFFAKASEQLHVGTVEESASEGLKQRGFPVRRENCFFKTTTTAVTGSTGKIKRALRPTTDMSSGTKLSAQL